MMQKVKTEGSQRPYNALAPRSNFHNYVCQTLLQTIEKPAKVINFEEKMSNPVSITTPKRTSTSVVANSSQAERTGEAVSETAMKRLLEDFYKKPIALQAVRLSTSPLGGGGVTDTRLTTNDNLLIEGSRKSSRLPSVPLGNVKLSEFARTSIALSKGERSSFRSSTMGAGTRNYVAQKTAELRLSTLT